MLPNRSIDRSGCQRGLFHPPIVLKLCVGFIAAVKSGCPAAGAPVSVRRPGKDAVDGACVARVGALLLQEVGLDTTPGKSWLDT
jgi:hypothetical protein